VSSWFLAGGGLGSIPGLPEAWGVFIIWSFAVQEQFVAKFKEVARMVKSLTTMNPLVGVFLFAAGIKVSSSPA
jgi:hypothetical protein